MLARFLLTPTAALDDEGRSRSRPPGFSSALRSGKSDTTPTALPESGLGVRMKLPKPRTDAAVS